SSVTVAVSVAVPLSVDVLATSACTAEATVNAENTTSPDELYVSRPALLPPVIDESVPDQIADPFRSTSRAVPYTERVVVQGNDGAVNATDVNTLTEPDTHFRTYMVPVSK